MDLATALGKDVDGMAKNSLLLNRLVNYHMLAGVALKSNQLLDKQVLVRWKG